MRRRPAANSAEADPCKPWIFVGVDLLRCCSCCCCCQLVVRLLRIVLADFYGHGFARVSPARVYKHTRRVPSDGGEGDGLIEYRATESLTASAMVGIFHGERNMSHSLESVASLQPWILLFEETKAEKVVDFCVTRQSRGVEDQREDKKKTLTSRDVTKA